MVGHMQYELRQTLRKLLWIAQVLFPSRKFQLGHVRRLYFFFRRTSQVGHDCMVDGKEFIIIIITTNFVRLGC
jgi:hypothetical protein